MCLTLGKQTQILSWNTSEISNKLYQILLKGLNSCFSKVERLNLTKVFKGD